MSTAGVEALGGAGGGEGGAGEGGAGAGGEGGGGGGREWMATLPEPLRANETLGRFADVGALAQGYLETKAAATNRAAIPATDAAPEVWNQFYEQLGRPKEATAYDFAIPEGQTSPLADAFRPKAHELNLTTAQAKGVAEFWNAQNAETAAADRASLAAFKAEKGADYAKTEAAAIAAYKALGFDGPEFPEALSRLTNSGVLIRGFAQIAEKIGEHGIPPGADGQDPLTGVADSQAQAKIDALGKDPEWTKKLMAKDVTVNGQYQQLLRQAQRHAARNP